jgi:hypothetical protein
LPELPAEILSLRRIPPALNLHIFYIETAIFANKFVKLQTPLKIIIISNCRGDEKMTVEIEMTDEEFKTVSEYAAEKNFSLSEFFLKTMFEKIQNKNIYADSEVQQSENFNDETITAIIEAREIAEGKISAKSFNSVKELMEDLMSDVDD